MNIQIAGIAVAAVIVVLLVIALVVTRKGGDDAPEAHGEPGSSSFLDSPPSDTLAKLGTPEQAAAGAVVVPSPPAASPDAPQMEQAAAERTPGPDRGAGAGPAAAPPAGGEADSETTGEMPALPAEPEPAAAEPEAGAETVAASAAGPESLVPLSSIIVTTSTKMVDLNDLEIRRMLTDLVTFEIDQATQSRERGQNLDAVLQLTEAEKICRALGKEDTAREIRDMMRGLRA